MNTTPWWMNKVYSLDTETTSADPAQARVLTAALVRIDNGTEIGNAKTWTLNPGVQIPEESIKIHGLTQEFIEKNGTDPVKGIDEIIQLAADILNAGYPLIVFNAAYDLSVLETEAKRYGVPTLRERVKPESLHRILDPMVLGKGVQTIIRRKFVKGQNFKLPTLCKTFNVDFEECHEATEDAAAAGRLLVAIVADEPRLQEFNAQRFWVFQRAWRRASQESLREYFDKKEIEHDGVDPSWPFYAFVEAK